MINDLNNLINQMHTETFTGNSTQYKRRENVVTIKRSALEDHPSYMKGYEMGLKRERGDQPYDIDYNLQEHLIAFSLGYNQGLLEPEEV